MTVESAFCNRCHGLLEPPSETWMREEAYALLARGMVRLEHGTNAMTALTEVLRDGSALSREGQYEPCECPPPVRSGIGVYRLRDAAGLLLYIGSSRNCHSRVTRHRRRSWGSLIEHVEVIEYPTIEEARAAEAAAIREEQPRYNVAGTYVP